MSVCLLRQLAQRRTDASKETAQCNKLVSMTIVILKARSSLFSMYGYNPINMQSHPDVCRLDDLISLVALIIQ